MMPAQLNATAAASDVSTMPAQCQLSASTECPAVCGCCKHLQVVRSCQTLLWDELHLTRHASTTLTDKAIHDIAAGTNRSTHESSHGADQGEGCRA